jgi:CheY-like chemotaxis protein
MDAVHPCCNFQLRPWVTLMRILAVDDDPLQLQLLEAILEDAGYSDVTTATSAAIALRMILNKVAPFECLLLDIQMPELDGIDLTRTIRFLPEYEETPIIMVTAMSERSYIDRAFVAGAFDYITKPYDKLELTTRINNAVLLSDSSRQEVENQRTIQNLKQREAASHRFTLEAPVPIEGIANVVDVLRLQNYLLQLGRLEYSQTDAIAFRIAEFPELHKRIDHSELYGILSDVAEAIAKSFVGCYFLVSYIGYGVFVCVFARANAVVDESILQTVQAHVEAFELEHPNGDRLFVSITGGHRVSGELSLFSDKSGLIDRALRGVGLPSGSTNRLEEKVGGDGLMQKLRGWIYETQT